eukprot:7347295-Prymnesium_polylepis.1
MGIRERLRVRIRVNVRGSASRVRVGVGERGRAWVRGRARVRTRTHLFLPQRPPTLDDRSERAARAQLHNDPHLPYERVAERVVEVDDVLMPCRRHARAARRTLSRGCGKGFGALWMQQGGAEMYAAGWRGNVSSRVA